MAQVSDTEFGRNWAAYMEQVCKTQAPLTITRQSGAAVVVMSEDEYEGLLETVHLLKSPANASRLQAAVAVLEAGAGIEHDPT